MEPKSFEKIQKILEKEETTIKDLINFLSEIEIRKTVIALEKDEIKPRETTKLEECRVIEIPFKNPVDITVMYYVPSDTGIKVNMKIYSSPDGVVYDTIPYDFQTIESNTLGLVCITFSYQHLPRYVKIVLENTHDLESIRNVKVYISY